MVHRTVSVKSVWRAEKSRDFSDGHSVLLELKKVGKEENICEEKLR